MTTLAPVIWKWTDDGVMAPLSYFARRCDATFVVGECYYLQPADKGQTDRDKAYHASLRKAWINLPERYNGQFPQYHDFRKWCLLKTGFVTISRVPCPNLVVAYAMIPHIKDKFSIVQIEGTVIVITTPLSQKTSEANGGMSKEDRYRSYTETLNYAAGLIGVHARDLEREAGVNA